MYLSHSVFPVNRKYVSLLILLTVILESGRVLAQSPAGRLTNTGALRAKAAQWKTEYAVNREKALQLARKRGWPVKQLLPDGTIVSLEGLDENGQPVYYTTDNNVRAAATTRTNGLWAGGSLGLHLSGSSAALSGKMGIWDGGPVRATHRELTGRLIQRDAGAVVDPGTGSNHATHVAGTLIAKGVNPLAKGMAHNATNLQAYDFSNDLSEMAAAASGLLLSNHSYGTLAGWRLNASRAGTATDPQWEWLGDVAVSDKEDWHFGFYNNDARRWDEIAFNAPYYLPVKSSGNNRNSNGPAIGQPYWRLKSGGGYELIASRSENVSSNNTYDIISTYGNAKNILTVGAVDPIPGGSNQAEDIRISSFSSWGPTDDGRIKPDIVANGIAVTSSGSNSDDTYVTLNGTSMAAPNVTGTLLLLQEHYANHREGVFMRAATLKGLAIHTADEAGSSPGPDYQYGWGLLNAEKAAKVITNADSTHLLAERSLAQGETYTLPVTASGKGPLVVTISWTDPPGTVLSATTANLNNRTPRLVNDLDVRLWEANNTFLPWTLNPVVPDAAATTGDNIRDNVEQILVANPIPGKVYTIRIAHKNTLQNASQAYSLLVSGIGGKPYCAPASLPGTGSRIEKVTFGEINNSSATECQTFTDFTRFSATAATGQIVPVTITVGSCGSAGSSITKVYADWNGNGTFTDANEQLAVSEVLAGNATFTTNITVPMGITAGNATRLRVVTAATTDASKVNPCGSGAPGETEEYTLRFVRPANDVGAVTLIAPDLSLCAGPVPNVTVTIRNLGSATQTTIPVAVTIRNGQGQELGVLRGIFTGILLPFGEGKVTLPGNFNAAAGDQLTFTIRTNLTNDQDSGNNTVQETRFVSSTPPPSAASATICAGDSVQLQATGDGTPFWYDSPDSQTPIATGKQTRTAVKPAAQTYYVALNDWNGSIGPVSKNTFGGGTYGGNFGPQPLITTQVPLVLESARLYIGNPGRITFTVETPTGIAITSTTLDVAATRNPAVPAGNVSGQLADDPNDQGAVYPLNLTIPTPGSYRISIAYENGASIFRSNAGVSGYPFQIPHVLSIGGAFFTGNTITNSWYYFYDLKVKSPGCASARTPVNATLIAAPPPTAVLSGGASICEGIDTTLTVTLIGTPPWNLTYARDTILKTITGITASPYRFRVSEAGTYRLISLTDARSCPVSRLNGNAVITLHPTPPLLLPFLVLP